MPVDIGLVHGASGMTSGAIATMRQGADLLSGSQDPTVVGAAGMLSSGFDQLSQALEALNQVVMQLAEASNQSGG